MKDDYLWDKSGEPDPEIQHLERVLGQLRHQRDAKEIVEIADMPVPHRRKLPALLAIAAAFLFVALALGLWVSLRLMTEETHQQNVAGVKPEVKSDEQTEKPEQKATTADVSAKVERETENARPPVVKVSDTNQKASATVRRRGAASRAATLENERAETARGEMAKQQLIKALRITSTNLDLVQKKVRDEEGFGPSS